jgi:ribose transport system substrate-binding protein
VAFLLAWPAGCRESAIVATSPAAAEPTHCQREPVKSSDALTIAVIPMGSTHEFWKAIHAGAVKAETELKGVQVIWKGPIREDDREGQISVLENFINVGVSGIAIAPLDNVALVRPVREAVKAGVGVVVMDSDLDAQVCTDFASQNATNS